MKYLSLLLALFLSQTGMAQSPQKITLKGFLQAVESQSPDLAVEKSLKEEASARAQGIRINPPMVGLMNMRDASGNNSGVEISQEIPFPTKISKEKEMRSLEAQAQSSSLQYRKNEILLNARSAYFEFWQAYEKAQILKEKRDLLKSHSKISRSSARADSAAQVHLMGIESEVDLLENESLEAESTVIEKRNALKTFAPDLPTTDAVPLEPKMESIEVSQKSKSALMTWKEKELQTAEASQSLKKQAALPDFFVRFRGYNGNEQTARSEEIMIGITLPFLYFWQPQADAAEASARTQRAQAELRKTQVELESRLTSLIQKTESLKKQLNTLNDKLIPRAHKRMRVVENFSQRTVEGLDEHRTVMVDYLDLRMKALDVRTQYENAISEILKLAQEEVKP